MLAKLRISPGFPGFAVAFALGVTAPVMAQDAQPAPFAGEISEFTTRDRVRMPHPCGVVFVGSSSIKLWVGLERDFPRLNIVHRGFGGSQTEHATRYFEQLVGRYRPAKIVFYEGENDLDAGKDVATVLADLKAFMATKRAILGATPVFFISVKPSPSRWQQFARQSELNGHVRAIASEAKDLVFVDVVPRMLDKDGRPRAELFIDDELHINAKGYAIWRDLVSDALAREPASAAPGCPNR